MLTIERILSRKHSLAVTMSVQYGDKVWTTSGAALERELKESAHLNLEQRALTAYIVRRPHEMPLLERRIVTLKAFEAYVDLKLKVLDITIKLLSTSEAQRFLAGHQDRLKVPKLISPDDICIPFKRTYIEVETPFGVGMALVQHATEATTTRDGKGVMLDPSYLEHYGEEALFAVFLSQSSGQARMHRFGILWEATGGEFTNGGLKYTLVPLCTLDHFHVASGALRNDLVKQEEKFAIGGMTSVCKFLYTINSDFAVFEQKLPAPSAHKPKKDRPPTLVGQEYKVLILRTDEQRIRRAPDPGGNTHRSPRLHLRRAHWRRYRNDDGTIRFRRWIEAMWVGDKAGKIEKEYALPSAVRKYE